MLPPGFCCPVHREVSNQLLSLSRKIYPKFIFAGPLFLFMSAHIYIYTQIYFWTRPQQFAFYPLLVILHFFLLVDGLVAWYICFSGSFLFSFNAKMFPTELIILGANQRLPTAALLYPYIPESLNFQHSLYFSTLCSIYIYTHSTVFYLRRASS